MKTISNYITEKFKINSKNIKPQYNYHPKNLSELQKLCRDLIKERGGNANLNDIDTSNIKYMLRVFMGQPLGPDFDVSQWDVSNVESMSAMFKNCGQFNCDLSNWDVSNVKKMRSMFEDCEEFQGIGLDKWNVRDDCDTRWMFNGCTQIDNYPKWYKNETN